MGGAELPLTNTARSRSTHPRPLLLALCAVVATATFLAYNAYLSSITANATKRVQHVPLKAQRILAQCAALQAVPGPPENFLARDTSDRFEPGTRPTLIRNATLWTGARNGTEIVYGDVYMDRGIVKGIGYIPQALYAGVGDVEVIDAGRAWVTPGLVDLHSHVGVFSAPFLRGAQDVNSGHGPVLPWLRSIDGFNTHDDALELAIAGGVTSVQVLPGSANAIGGQAFIFKLRKTSDRSPTSMIVEPPHTLNGSEPDSSRPLRWRHMKQACGENLRRYGNRMDSMWSFRSAYNEARKIKYAQDTFCAKAEAGLWDQLEGEDFPESLQWEALVDVLRGRVKIANHCYEEVDLDDIVRLTNEFQFPIASFHHASEAWLVPDVLKKTWGGTPAIAIFATNHRYKRESYRGSEFAPRVLADNGIPVVMKSDHPVLNSRYLAYEAQQAHYYGLPPHLALLSVTAMPASTAGMSHRIGILREGADADVVLWDTHPLQLGATPRKVWIDGILQVGADQEAIVIGKGKEDREFQETPRVPNWDKERRNAVKWEGLPPLTPAKENGRVVFHNVGELWVRDDSDELGIREVFNTLDGELVDVVVDGGKISCVGKHCMGGINANSVIDLRGGSISPSLMTFGSPIGIEEIAGEVSTGDGATYDPFKVEVPQVLGDPGGLVMAADALQFGTRNAHIAHRAGVTYATSSLSKTTLFAGPSSIFAGLSVTFRTGAAHALERGAIIKHITALHVVIGRAAPYSTTPWASVSTQIATLRNLLLNGQPTSTETGKWFKKAAQGAIPLVIEVGSADIMATLINLKNNIEQARGSFMKMVFAGAAEAHLLADDIANANIGIILQPIRPFPNNWDNHRILAGPPVTNETSLTVLTDAGVRVAVGVLEAWQAGNTGFDVQWAALETNGRIDRKQAHALVSTNLEKLLDVDGWIGDDGDLVAYEGGSAFDFSSKVVAVASPGRGVVELL
ncbi:uncharacterized protein FIBRA_04424 [Fibroporia radiculosa]|uniref:Amidohydrolase-related domain-containing protein n=1 Tax=Fibroporia radiculosa TaxID=599839 RepID=J4HWI7_9APHY|nr:uncharacterized protein FIBRA_04424 [Fibroporia radiculosa]CCM02332.1 predicted protein [Fibroporia radiculosa]